jgi:antirestriction protein ArdC
MQKEKEVDKQHSAQQAHEKIHVSRPIPSKKRPSVFYWDDVDGF